MTSLKFRYLAPIMAGAAMLHLACRNEVRLLSNNGEANIPPAKQGSGTAPSNSSGQETGRRDDAGGNGDTGGSGGTGSEQRLLDPLKWLCCKYPFPAGPLLDFTIEGRGFGASRDDGSRKHAGVDLVYDEGTVIYAIGDGQVLDVYEFYQGTWAMEVKHRDFIVRYGEISPSGPVFHPGYYVRQWQRLAFVGSIEMLHLEMYSGSKSGPLTNRDNYPYQRRGDLLDPTKYVKEWMESTLNLK